MVSQPQIFFSSSMVKFFHSERKRMLSSAGQQWPPVLQRTLRALVQKDINIFMSAILIEEFDLFEGFK
jgi:hypothetical protein